ncbi:multidrug transporter [Candidatus Woesearchaeota archaeon]|nr:multidrug transporter [Candidatus Woesearchaeota archaeon]
MVKYLALLLVLIATLIGAVGALTLKKATSNHTFREMLFNSKVWVGFFLYGLSTIFYILALRMEQLSVVYPLVSLSYLWTTSLSIKFLGEKMNVWKYLALGGIIVGVTLIGVGS